MRVTIRGLPGNTLVLNASGADPEGMPYIQHDYPLAPGASRDLTLEYLLPNGVIPQPTLFGRAASPAPLIEPVGTLQEISRGARLANGCYVVRFLSQNPSTYHVQCSSDLDIWKTASPSFTGNGGGLQWVDNGPPKTESHPLTQLSRFYRLVRVAEGARPLVPWLARLGPKAPTRDSRKGRGHHTATRPLPRGRHHGDSVGRRRGRGLLRRHRTAQPPRAHLARCWHPTRRLDPHLPLPGTSNLGRRVLKTPFRIENGHISIPTGAGLGIKLDEARLAEQIGHDWRNPETYSPDNGSVVDW